MENRITLEQDDKTMINLGFKKYVEGETSIPDVYLKPFSVIWYKYSGYYLIFVSKNYNLEAFSTGYEDGYYYPDAIIEIHDLISKGYAKIV